MRMKSMIDFRLIQEIVKFCLIYSIINHDQSIKMNY